MSYLDLWDKFTDVRGFWAENRKTIDEFSMFLKEKAELDRFYGKGLEKLGKLPLFDRSFGTISPAFQGLRTFYSESSGQLLYHADYLQNELFTKLKRIVLLQDANIHEYKQQGKRLVMEREKLVKNHLKCRNKYWKICKENESLTQKSNARPAQLEDGYNKAYMVAINQLNSFNPIFQDGMKRILLEYQSQNSEKLLELRAVFQKFVASEASNVYSMKMHLDNLPVAIDTFNPDVDQRMFVGSTFTGKLIEDESFLSYSHGVSEKNNIESVDSNDEETFEAIVNSCWIGNPLGFEDKKYFSEVISKDIAKRKFIMILNNKRKNGEFRVPKNTFADLGALFNLALDSFTEIEHLSVAKQCIILSQTFYTSSENPEEDVQKAEKTYLQSLIFDHPLWKKEDYWEYMVENAVQCSLKSLTEFDDELDTNDDLEIRKKSVISSAVISYAHIMSSFKIDKNRVISILEKTKAKHNLSDDELPLLYLVDLDN